MNSIRLEGTISEADYVHAQLLHIRQGIAIRVLLFVVLLVAAAGCVRNTMEWMEGTLSVRHSSWLPFPVALLVVSRLAFLPWWLRRSYRRFPAMVEPFSMSVGEEGVERHSELGQGILPWRMFIKWRESDRMLLLYLSPTSFLMLPLHLLTEGRPEDLRAIVTRHLGPARG